MMSKESLLFIDLIRQIDLVMMSKWICYDIMLISI